MKLWRLPIHIISDKKAENAITNRILAKLLEDNNILARANKTYAEWFKNKKKFKVR
jgi:hypothetical protein